MLKNQSCRFLSEMCFQKNSVKKILKNQSCKVFLQDLPQHTKCII